MRSSLSAGFPWLGFPVGPQRWMRAQSVQCRSCSPTVGKPNLGGTWQARDSSAHSPRASSVSKHKGPFPYLSVTPPPGHFVWCAHCRRRSAVICGSRVPLSNCVIALHFISLWVICVWKCVLSLGFLLSDTKHKNRQRFLLLRRETIKCGYVPTAGCRCTS